MKERPILFNGEMVRAILAGRKTQTRRPVKYISDLGDPAQWCHNLETVNKFCGDYTRYSPFGAPGNELWVRETFCTGMDTISNKRIVIYRATDPIELSGLHSAKWRPSIHMPRWASRIDLLVKRVWVERLQDILDNDAIKEGINPKEVAARGWMDARVGFRILWNSIYEKKSFGWDTNPWVWACEFEVAK